MRVSLPLLGNQELTSAWAWAEFKKLLKFGLVGGSTFLLFLLIYTLLSRVFWIDGPRTLFTFLSAIGSALYNFTMHRRWTFRSRAAVPMAVGRYALVVAAMTLFQTGLFSVGHDLLGWYDYLVHVIVAAPVAAATYVLHRWFTFHPKHGVR